MHVHVHALYYYMYMCTMYMYMYMYMHVGRYHNYCIIIILCTNYICQCYNNYYKHIGMVCYGYIWYVCWRSYRYVQAGGWLMGL